MEAKSAKPVIRRPLMTGSSSSIGGRAPLAGDSAFMAGLLQGKRSKAKIGQWLHQFRCATRERWISLKDVFVNRTTPLTPKRRSRPTLPPSVRATGGVLRSVFFTGLLAATPLAVAHLGATGAGAAVAHRPGDAGAGKGSKDQRRLVVIGGY